MRAISVAWAWERYSVRVTLGGQTVGQTAVTARLTGTLAKAMHGPCAIFVRRVAALSEPYRGVGVGGRGGLGEGGSGKGGEKNFFLS